MQQALVFKVDKKDIRVALVALEAVRGNRFVIRMKKRE